VVPQTLICLPRPGVAWQNALVLYAHGYVNPYFDKVTIPWDQVFLTDTSTTPPTQFFLPTLVTDMGYAFAATSYRKNGLVVLEALTDLIALRTAAQAAVKARYGSNPRYTFLTGPSEGGLITTLSIERYPAYYSGGLALCGPVGSFQKQINYWGDFRALFDVINPYDPLSPLPKGLPPTAIDIPDPLVLAWYGAGMIPPSPYKQSVVGNALADPAKAAALLKLSKAPIDPANPADTTAWTFGGLLDYNIFATENGQAVLGGNPYSNMTTVYSGSGDPAFDTLVNASIARYPADAAALTNVKKYETRGGFLWKPLINMHTTGDEIVPYWHATLYGKKVSILSFFRYAAIKVDRYGHCNFTKGDLLTGFGTLYFLATGKLPPTTSYAQLLPEQQRGKYLDSLKNLEKEKKQSVQPVLPEK
jgi:hypothetical protein